MNLIRVKKSFTLIELIVVILIMSTTYLLVFSSNTFSFKKNEEKVTLYNLKDFLMNNFSFEKELSFICIEEDFTCFVKADRKLIKDFKIKNFFKQKPEIYEYKIESERVDFKELRIDNFEYRVIFELKINNDYKTNEFIVDTLKDEVYVFNSIFTKPKIFKSLNEVAEAFRINQLEIKNAF